MRSSSIDKLVADISQRQPPLGVPVFASRLCIPVRRSGIVDRPALIDLLTAHSEAPCITMVAPAGYGKTTALGALESADQRPFAVLRIDDGFNDPAVFLTHLAISLIDAAGVDIGILEPLTAPTEPQRRRVIAQLAAAVVTSSLPFVLAIDDADRLDDPEGVGMLSILLEHLPDGSQIVLSSRREPGLPLATLRAEARVTDIGADALRLDAAGVRELLTEHGVSATHSEIDGLTARTEGWPVAVYLAARAAGARRADLSSFGGEDRTMSDYLRAEFLDHEPDDIARFLQRSSVLDELSGALCDAVLQRAGSASTLDAMERSNLLLIPMDTERHRYRLHRLLREMLRAQLERSEPELIPALRSRASRWYEDDGQLERAVSYAQDAGDVGRVEELMLRHGLRLYAMGRDVALQSCYGWLASKGSTDEAAAVLGGWIHLVTGARAEADRWLRIAESGSGDRILPDGSPVEGWTLALRSVKALDTDAMRQTASRSLELLSPTSQVRPTATAALAAAAYLDGEVDEAHRWFADAVELGVSLGGIAAAVISLAAQSLISIEGGRWDEASVFTERASEMIALSHLDGYPQAALVYAVRARLELHARDVRAASDSVGAAERLLPSLTADLAFPSLTTRLVLARVHLELGDIGAACDRLDEIAQLERDGLTFLVTRSETEHLERAIDGARRVAGSGGRLTPAELRLLPMLATHLTFREIAEQLFVSVHTVKAQVTSIYRKLGVASRTQAVDEARLTGLLDDRTNGPRDRADR